MSLEWIEDGYDFLDLRDGENVLGWLYHHRRLESYSVTNWITGEKLHDIENLEDAKMILLSMVLREPGSGTPT